METGTKVAVIVISAIFGTIFLSWTVGPLWNAQSNEYKLKTVKACLDIRGGSSASLESGMNQYQLANDWSMNPDKYEDDCYFESKITPYEVRELS